MNTLSPARAALAAIVRMTALVALCVANAGYTAQALNPPANITAVAASSSAIVLRWTDPGGPKSGYKIERSTDPSVGFAQIAAVGPSVTSYSDAGLAPATTHYYRARAYHKSRDSAYSPVASATTPAAPSPLPAPVPSATTPRQIGKAFFGNHVGGPLEVNLANQRVHTLWPTTNPTSIRVWDTWGYNPTKGTYDYMFWRHINTAYNTYDWTLFDKILGKYKAQGVTEIVYTIGLTPAWAGSAGGTTAPSDLSYLSMFVTAAAQRAIALGMPIRNWEIWNEPNASAFWTGTTAEMVAMSKTVYQAVKAVDPSYKVLSPSPQGSGADYWMGQFLAAGGGQWVDVIAYHGYINFYGGTASEEKFERLIYKLQSLMAQHGVASKELWDTEGFDLFTCAGTCYDYPSQSAYLAQRYLIAAAKGVSRVFWYAWDQNHGKQWGNESGTFQVNEVGAAHLTVMNWLLDSVVSNLVVSNGVYSVDITRNGVSHRAVWTLSGAASYPTAYSRFEDLAGVTGAVTGGAVTIGRKPVLLKN